GEVFAQPPGYAAVVQTNKPTTKSHRCTTCKGTRNCAGCGGLGEVRGRQCKSCGGPGECRKCAGRGVVKSVAVVKGNEIQVAPRSVAAMKRECQQAEVTATYVR